jgi:hypothetical protein
MGEGWRTYLIFSIANHEFLDLFWLVLPILEFGIILYPHSIHIALLQRAR